MEKCLTFSIAEVDAANNASINLKKKIKDAYSFAMPISSVGGKIFMEELEKNTPIVEDKKSYRFKKELIIVVTNRGYVDAVMDVARKSGAPGGTVIHARGTRN